MNNIQEKDWAEDAWCGHTGMDSASDYCVSSEKTLVDEEKKEDLGQEVKQKLQGKKNVAEP